MLVDKGSGVGLGLIQAVMQRKALQFAEEELAEEQCGKFKSSNNWFHRLCKQHDVKSIVLHGEGNEEIPEDERIKLMETCKKNEIKRPMDEHDIEIGNNFNADQTGLFYQKFSNRMYVSAMKDEQDKNDSMKLCGTNASHEGQRQNPVMVATSLVGNWSKTALSFAGKSKNPKWMFCIAQTL